jgi:hypothetical protein
MASSFKRTDATWATCDLNIRNAILDALVDIDVTPKVRFPIPLVCQTELNVCV